MNDDRFTSEADVIGGLIVEPSMLRDVSAVLLPEEFELELYRKTYESMLSIKERGEEINLISLSKEMHSSDGSKSESEWKSYLFQLAEITVTTAGLAQSVKAVKEEFIARQLREICEGVVFDAGKERPEELLQRLRDSLQDIDERLATDEKDASGADETLDLLRQIFNGEDYLVTTGEHCIDRVLSGGFRNGSLNILAASPGTGKTTLAIMLADCIAHRGGDVAFFSLEMDKAELNMKRLSAGMHISSNQLMDRDFIRQHGKEIKSYVEDIRASRMHIFAKPKTTVQYMESVCRKIKNLRFVVIDYLQLISSSKTTSSYERISEISRNLKVLAMTLGVPVLALCQLSRAARKENRRPKEYDLRDSGSLEQDADTIMMLSNNIDFQNEYQEEINSCPVTSESVMCEVVKNRRGSIGAALIRFDKEYSLMYGVGMMKDGEVYYDVDEE